MGKVLVVYDSASGNTAKMAGLVAEGAEGLLGVEVRLRKVEEATPEDVLWCDGLISSALSAAYFIPPIRSNTNTSPSRWLCAPITFS